MKAYTFSIEIKAFDEVNGVLPQLMSWKRRLICACLLLSLVACQGTSQPATGTPQHEPVTYQSLCGLTTDRFGAMSESEVVEWITTQNGRIFAPLTSGLYPEQKNQGVVAYGWMRPDQTGTNNNTVYTRNGKLLRISFKGIKNGPTFGDVVADLGAPDKLYRTARLYEKALYSIGLEYYTLGITVYSDRLVEVGTVLKDGKLILPFSADMPVQSVECYKGGSMIQVLHEVFFESEESITPTLSSLMPWPGFVPVIPYDNP